MCNPYLGVTLKSVAFIGQGTGVLPVIWPGTLRYTDSKQFTLVFADLWPKVHRFMPYVTSTDTPSDLGNLNPRQI